MANFLTAFDITMLTEGGYDSGVGEAETYMGVDRSQNGDWSGWTTIDAIKADNPGAAIDALNALFAADPGLQTAVQLFYHTNYWEPYSLDKVTDQQVGNALFDCAVNPCILSISKAAQIACNVVLHHAVTVDGEFGRHTLAGINATEPNLYVTALNGVRTANYYERVNLDPADEEWLGSWLGRCKPYN